MQTIMIDDEIINDITKLSKISNPNDAISSILKDFIQRNKDQNKEPNQETIDAMNEDISKLKVYKNADDMFDELGI